MKHTLLFSRFDRAQKMLIYSTSFLIVIVFYYNYFSPQWLDSSSPFCHKLKTLDIEMAFDLNGGQ